MKRQSTSVLKENSNKKKKDSQVCQHPECPTQSVYNFAGKSKRAFCAKHMKEGMINVKAKPCQHPGCPTRPNYNFEEESKGAFCAKHMKEGMIDVIHKTCQHSGCSTRPNYNFEGELKGAFCAKHVKEGMIDVVNKTCQHVGCHKQPVYNFEGKTKRAFCAEHKELIMINVKDKTCQHPGCPTIPAYNFKGELKRAFCAEHKEETMIDVVNKTCQHPGCPTIPSYNFEGESKGAFCVKHMKEGMINVVNPTCQHVGCKTRASYGTVFERKIHCAKHKTKSEIVVKTCTHKGDKACRNPATYNDTNTYPAKRCFDHKEDEDCELGTATCINCGDDEILYRDSKCYRCSTFILHAKEMVIYDLLEAWEKHQTREEGALSWKLESHDRVVEGSEGCVSYRPDFILDYGVMKVVVEVDEHQHSSYAPGCDEARMRSLFQQFQGFKVHFVRYNPDGFKVGGERASVSSKVRQRILKEYLERLRFLRNEPVYMLSVKYLFYDECCVRGNDFTKHLKEY
jgi:hypothetical protein